MNAKTDFQGVHFRFRRPQVLSVDLRKFLRVHEPAKLNPFELRCSFGQLCLELEDAANYGDLFTIPETRTFVQALHHAWQWAGFFLDLKRPLGSPRGMGRLPILAYALCVVDVSWIASDATQRCAIRFNEGQFTEFRDQTFAGIDELGERAEIPREVLFGRKEAVARQLNRILELR